MQGCLCFKSLRYPPWMAAPRSATAGAHSTSLLGLFWVVVWNVCWYLSLKWTAGYDRKRGSQTSFKCHFTKHIAEHGAVETSCYRCFSRWKQPTLCKIKLATCLPCEHCACAICAARCIWTQTLVSHYIVSSPHENKYSHEHSCPKSKHTLWKNGSKGAYVMKRCCRQVSVSNLFVLRLPYLMSALTND